MTSDELETLFRAWAGNGAYAHQASLMRAFKGGYDAAEQRAQAAEAERDALRAALEMAERGTSTRRRQIAPESRPWRLFCEICDMDGPEDGPIDHATDCPFSALLRAAEGGER